MRVREPGWITPRLALVGPPGAASYLVRGRDLALVGAGVAWEVVRIEEDLDRVGADRSRLRYLVVSHVHHDHCGALPYLARRYPGIETVASRYGAHLLAKDTVAALMDDLNRRTLERLGRPLSHGGIPLRFEPLEIARPVSDGDRLDLGEGVTLEFIETPGHSRCSLTVYIPAMEALLPGDAIPYPASGSGPLTVTANHDYGDYLRSLRKLVDLPVGVVCYEHGGAILGDEAATIVSRGLEATLAHRERIRARHGELGDLEALVAEIAAKYHELELFRLVPEDVMRAIVRRMVQSALRPD